MERWVSRRRSVATCMRQPVRYFIGGTPISSEKRSANAERDARIAVEGLYTDPIQQVVERDEPEIASGTPELDF